jgi:hypothetical protein
MAHTTNYHNAFIAVADDCPATTGLVPPARDPRSVAQIQYELVIDHPYEFTSDDAMYVSNGERRGISREDFFARGQACFRASPLTKRYGWGVHSNAEGKIALYPVNSEQYTALANDPDVDQVRGMRSNKT